MLRSPALFFLIAVVVAHLLGCGRVRFDALDVEEAGRGGVGGSNIIQAALDGLNLTADFRLEAGSIAIDAGLGSHAGFDAPNVDIDGNARPQGGCSGRRRPRVAVILLR
jgi:hypothetical protein